MWCSVVAAVAAYHASCPAAGYLLAPSAGWLSVASVLTWTIWKINPPLEPLLPVVDDGKALGSSAALSEVVPWARRRAVVLAEVCSSRWQGAGKCRH